MLGTQWTKRTRNAERIAEQAWEHLVSAVDSAGGTARSAKRHARHLGSEAQDWIGSATDEGRHRARNALDALAGRRAATPWGLLVGLTAAGLAIGWVAATVARRASVALVEASAEADTLDEEMMGLRP